MIIGSGGTDMSEKILAVDGHSIMNRAFYGMPDLTDGTGRHTGAVYGFLNTLFRVMEEEKPQYLVVAFDMHAPTFRHKAYAAYKGTRHPMPDELREQIPLIQQVLKAMRIPVITKEGYEADDILGTISRKAEATGRECTILSGDRDLLQLATEHTMILLPKTKGGETLNLHYHAQDVIDEYGITPAQVVEIKALEGDSADNIPGLPGIGKVTAQKILQQYGTAENAHDHLDELKPPRVKKAFEEHWEMAVLSRDLAEIRTNALIDIDWDEAGVKDPGTPEARDMFRQFGFRQLLARLGGDTAEETEKARPDVKILMDFGDVDEAFHRMKNASEAGICLLSDFDRKTQKAEIRGIAGALGRDDIFYIPVNGFVAPNFIRIELTEAIRTGKLRQISMFGVKEFLRAMTSEPVGGSDVYEPGRYFDCGIAAYLLDPLTGNYAPDTIGAMYIQDMSLPAPEEIFGGKKIPAAADMPQEQAALYAGESAYAALACRKPLEEALREQGMLQLFRDIEMPLVFTLRDMEREGMRVLPEALHAYGENLTDGIDTLEKQIYEEAGEEFNINSPRQLGAVLFEKKGLPGGKKTKTGYSTSADILEPLAAQFPLVQHVLDYRQLTKLRSTYAEGLAGEIADDGKIHTTFHQTITATGRISSTDPNLQNIPVRVELGRQLRKIFVPADGYVYIDADYSQIELRVLASLSGDQKLISAYRDAEDIHRITASQVFHVPFDEVTPLQRRRAKAVNFGIVYGISSYGLSQDLGISRKEAEEYIQSYYETYPGIRGYLEGLVASARSKGYTETYFGRRRPMPELKSSNFMTRQFGERVAKNAPIQGTAADIIKIAMNRVSFRLRKEGLKARLILQVHDELLVEAPVDEEEAVKRILTEEMTGAADLAVKMEVSLGCGANWYEAH